MTVDSFLIDENEEEALDEHYLPLRDCISESQGYQAFPPLIMSQPPVVYVLAEPGPNKELRDTGHLVGQQMQ